MGSGAFLVEACRQLGDALVEAWHAHGGRPDDPARRGRGRLRPPARRAALPLRRGPEPDGRRPREALALARDARQGPRAHVPRPRAAPRRLAGRAARGARSRRSTGTTRAPPAGFERCGSRAPRTRRRAARRDPRGRRGRLRLGAARPVGRGAARARAGAALRRPRRARRSSTATKPKEREAKRAEFASAVADGDAERYRGWLEEARDAEPPLAPFHWEIEFPEVFDRENPGFDAFVGNPPFAGKNTLVAGNPRRLSSTGSSTIHEGAHGNADLVAHFFRRAFDLLRDGGTLRPDRHEHDRARATRARPACAGSARTAARSIAARRRVKWPGLAAVVVSVVHVTKGALRGPRRLDGREVDTITAFLFHAGGHDDPARLAANAGKSFHRELSSSAWASPSTTPTRRASPRRSPRCTG